MQYKIGKIAKIMGVTPEAIRHYERLGLIVPFKDPETNYRYYTSEQIDQLLDQRCFSSSQKAGDNIDFRHSNNLLSCSFAVFPTSVSITPGCETFKYKTILLVMLKGNVNSIFALPYHKDHIP